MWRLLTATLVAVYSSDIEQRRRMEHELSKLVWADPLIGRAQKVVAQAAIEFQAVRGLQVRSGFIVIQPGRFGLPAGLV